ncbi:unnamed protein product [Adineta ricciae]|nr:unnamed protein product [Adineta ricciae]
MQSSTIYCLFLCTMIIFAAHQTNAMAIGDKSVAEPAVEITFEQSTAESKPLLEKHHEKRQNIQCGNGVVTISQGEIMCG